MSASELEASAHSISTPSGSSVQDRDSVYYWRSAVQRLPRVCKICRVGKRKCDKHHPACGRCERLGLNCSYDDPVIIESANTQEPATPGDPGSTSQVPLTLPVELDLPETYPIQKRWYMPFLLQQFLQEFGLSKISVDPNSIAYQMRTVYVRQSLTDPCMFHATLYAASAHMDAARNDCDNPITLYHQTQTLHLVRQRITQSQHSVSGGLDGAIAGVIPLAFFSYLLGDITESQNHLDGLVQMMATRGGRRNLGLSGLLDGLITLSALVFTIVFNHSYLELSSLAWTDWPLRPPIEYISKLITEVHKAYGEGRLSKSVHDAIHDIYDTMWSSGTASHSQHHRAFIASIYERWRSERNRYVNELDSAETLAVSIRSKERQTPVVRAVYLTGILFFTILDEINQSQITTLVQCKLLEELTVVLRETRDSVWLDANPFLFSWLCLTGAAASESIHQRAWLYYRQGPIFMALVNGPSCIQSVLSYYTWLRNHVTQLEC